jgi:hypothetical protein
LPTEGDDKLKRRAFAALYWKFLQVPPDPKAPASRSISKDYHINLAIKKPKLQILFDHVNLK